MKRALASIIGLTLACAGCGGGDDEDSTRVSSKTLAVYASFPRHGLSAAAGEAAFAGARRALRDAGGRAGGRRVRLVPLSSTEPGDALWDPDTVNANADRARKDPSTIAYLGELDYGGSAISLPITNRAGLLQVSPADGLTSLTRRPPGRPRAGPERYYPHRHRSFLRLVPSDLVLADRLLGLLERRGLGRIALVHGEGIADRELAAVLAARIRGRGGGPAFVEPLDDPDSVPSLLERLDAARPQVVVHAGARGRGTAALLTALGRRLPNVPVVGTSGLATPGPLGDPRPRDVRALTAVVPRGGQPPEGRRLLRALERAQGGPLRPEALYGYEAMVLVLKAIDRAGPDRLGVIRAALAPRRLRSVIGPVAIRRGGEARARVALVSLDGPRRTLERFVK